MSIYTDVRANPTAFRASTSFTPSEFDSILPVFRKVETDFSKRRTFDGHLRERRPGAGAKSKKLGTPEDRLFFVLYFTKTNPLQHVSAGLWGLSQGRINYWLHKLLPLLKETINQFKALPERAGSNVESHPLALEGGRADSPPCLSIDGSDRQRQRPRDETQQRTHYSGKQKAHTDKNIVVVNQNTTRIAYLGPTEPGSVHDKKAIDNAAIKYPEDTMLYKDTGFQGYEPPGTQTFQPKKSPAGAS